MQKIYNYFILFAVISAILYYNSATKVEGFSLPGVISLPGVSLPGVSLHGVRPLVRRARLFGENTVRNIEKMSTNLKAKAMMGNK
jgi:hypothetical protein